MEKMKLSSPLGLHLKGRASPPINRTHEGKQTAERWKAWVLQMAFEPLDQTTPDFSFKSGIGNLFL